VLLVEVELVAVEEVAAEEVAVDEDTVDVVVEVMVVEVLVVEEEINVVLLYTLRALEPPQSSVLFPAHSMVHPVPVEAVRVWPQ
jgi:hypothetical protein